MPLSWKYYEIILVEIYKVLSMIPSRWKALEKCLVINISIIIIINNTINILLERKWSIWVYSDLLDSNIYVTYSLPLCKGCFLSTSTTMRVKEFIQKTGLWVPNFSFWNLVNHLSNYGYMKENICKALKAYRIFITLKEIRPSCFC